MTYDLIPRPKQINISKKIYILPGNGVWGSGPEAKSAADQIAARFHIPIVEAVDASAIRLSIADRMDVQRRLRPEQHLEFYQLSIDASGIMLSALTGEGLLRGTATLFQLAQSKRGRWTVPYATITDWPNTRFRCASDWLINTEQNRWAYDWGDGQQAFVKRIERKLDFCFDHKINMVWFDGFGWDANRFPGYAALMRHCTGYARRLGIRLCFSGYGGGYGPAYVDGGIFWRHGYSGQIFINRRPYPKGPIVPCCGWAGNDIRIYGTCPSNSGLKAAKLEEMKRFVTEINPGFMYIHDLDAEGWRGVKQTWLQRCPACRKRWPNDELAAADGHAGAYAAWFRQVRSELSALPSRGDYVPARDLTVIFISPLYSSYRDSPKIWEREKQYFTLQSRLIGPMPGLEFGLREQFYKNRNRKRITDLRQSLESVGHGHGIHVIAFGGGDNWQSDDLANISGVMANFYEDAESVCLSNGGVHEDPIQLLNADCLWSGSAGGYREQPANATEAEQTFASIQNGTNRPPEIFSANGYFNRLCVHLWGPKAGPWMKRALTTRQNGYYPVSRVWFAVTSTIEAAFSQQPNEREWISRKQASVAALAAALNAARLNDSEDIRWLIQCLEVGKRFAEAVIRLVRFKDCPDKATQRRLEHYLTNLGAYIRAHFALKKTDKLGGDPGCWLDTLSEMKRLSRLTARQHASGILFGNFITGWKLHRTKTGAGKLERLGYPDGVRAWSFKSHTFPSASCNALQMFPARGFSCESVIYFLNTLRCDTDMDVELRLGYNTPIKVWLDRHEVFHDPDGKIPVKVDNVIIRWKANKGCHELMIALADNYALTCELMARFCRQKASREVSGYLLPICQS